MKRLIQSALCVVVLSATASLTSAQTLSDAEVDSAIKAGQAKKFGHLVSDCNATAGMGEGIAASLAGGMQPNGGFSVTVSANAGRIAFLATDSKRLYKSFSAADVPETLRVPTIFVFADPQAPSRSQNTVSIASPVERIVLKSKVNPERVAQPEQFETENVEWSNLLGGKVAGTRGLARFDLNTVKELPPGDFDVVVITQAGERRCKVGAKDRAKLFPAK
jgi:hypothetical protein